MKTRLFSLKCAGHILACTRQVLIPGQYHTGFRHQVQSWPVNPVSHYISELSKYPAKTVIADLGCGDAALAQALVPKGLTVLSFDLVSDGAYVVEADICSKLPLPGAEVTAEDGAHGAQVVDVVVFALSLMSVNWVGAIREAWRVLKAGYAHSGLLYARRDPYRWAF